MDKEDIKSIRLLIWKLSQKQNLDSEEITSVSKTLRRLLDAYVGTTKKLFKLRSRLRENDE